MEIKLYGQGYWIPKKESVIFVETENDIEKLFELLCEQDKTWESFKHLIQVTPRVVNSVGHLNNLCSNAGRTDIYKIEEIKKQVDFFIYQIY